MKVSLVLSPSLRLSSVSLRRRRHRKHGVRASERANRKKERHPECSSRPLLATASSRARRVASSNIVGPIARVRVSAVTHPRGGTTSTASVIDARTRVGCVDMNDIMRSHAFARSMDAARVETARERPSARIVSRASRPRGGRRWVDRLGARDGALRARGLEKRDECARYSIDRV